MSDGRVAFDLSIARVDRTGSGVYATCLAEALAPLMGERFVPIATRFVTALNGRRRVRDRLATLGRDLWWHQLGVAVAARKRGAELLHLPAGLGPIRNTTPVVVTLHDVMVLRWPAEFRPWFRRYAAVVMPRVARAARAVITGSEASRIEIATQFDIPLERIHVTPYGIDPRLKPVAPDDPRSTAIRSRYRLPSAYVLSVGAHVARKNLVRVVKAVRLLHDQRETRDLIVVHAGPHGTMDNEVADAVRSQGLAQAVLFLGYVATEDLGVLYSLARGLVFPSLHEGFGLPVAEAMACGCPVITSDRSSLAEVAGDDALLVDPSSIEDIAGALRRLWTDAALRSTLARRGLERATRYSWQRTAAATVAVYDSALS